MGVMKNNKFIKYITILSSLSCVTIISSSIVSNHIQLNKNNNVPIVKVNKIGDSNEEVEIKAKDAIDGVASDEAILNVTLTTGATDEENLLVLMV